MRFIVLSVLLLFCVTIYTTYDNLYVLPSDEQLISTFTRRRADFDELARFAANKDFPHRVHARSIFLEILMIRDKYNGFGRVLRHTGIREAVLSLNGNALFEVKGWGVIEGYSYQTTESQKVSQFVPTYVSDLDKAKLKPGGILFRKLDDHWSLVIWDDY